jgi:hypothetical protein
LSEEFHMSINDSIRNQLDTHIQQMYSKGLKGEAQSKTQGTGEGAVKNLGQALEDNKITGKELETLRNEYAKQGVSGEDFDKAISDIFGVSSEKLKSAGSSDAVISLDLSESGGMVNVTTPNQKSSMMVGSIYTMTDETIYNYSKDPNVTSAIKDGLGTPKDADQVKSLQEFLNNAKPPAKEKLDTDGLYGPITNSRLKNVFAEALKNKDFATVDKLILVVEAINNKVNQPGGETLDNQLQALYDTGYEFWDKNSKVKMEIGPVTITHPDKN